MNFSVVVKAHHKRRMRGVLQHSSDLRRDEATTRYRSIDDPEQWTKLDQIQTQIRFSGRHEVRTEILLNDTPWKLPYEALPGMKWRSGYVRKVHAVLTNPKVQITALGEGTLNGHSVEIYSYRAPADLITEWYIGE